MNKIKQYCGNCGKTGHNYKNCLAPIISLGVILIKKTDLNEYQYLMIQRRDTLGFVEFMRGKYSLDNINYIKQLFSIMTKSERDKIVKLDFDELWNQLWMNKNNKQYYNEYDSSKNKFYKLKYGFEIDDMYIDLSELNRIVKILYLTPEWGFPKGRRNLYETDINCAIREFEEETGIKNKTYELLKTPVISETFFGTNNIRYKHIYYIAKLLDENVILEIDNNNENQVTEISNIGWFNYNESLNIIRPYNTEKRMLSIKLTI